ncbi:MAG: bifunctional glycosyltransferase family 2/GtrA family protein [Lawsonibacter sp.]
MTDHDLRIALIPAYEPGQQLMELLAHIQEQGWTTVVIDDGSSIACSGLFEQASRFAAVLIHPENRGKGRALKSGLQYIRNHFRSPYTVVTMDADGQHRIADAVRVCEAAERNPDALVLGSRGFRNKVPLRSRLGNTITRMVYETTTGLQVEDTQTGLRAFHSELIPMLMDISGERYEYEMNVLLECAKRNIPIREVEIETIYIDNNAGSHFNTLKDSFRIYKEILRYSASSFASFLLDYSLYSLLTVWTAGLGNVSLPLSNVTARMISAGFNFTVNRRLVFKSERHVWASAAQYAALAAAILAGNTLVLSTLVTQYGMNPFGAKLLTELLFFTASWVVQRFVIFPRETEGKQSEAFRAARCTKKRRCRVNEK